MNQIDLLKKKFNEIYKVDYSFEDYIRDNAKDIILESGLFDEVWYSSSYPDVKELNIDFIDHYLNFGVDEGCNPNPFFDSIGYLNYYPDVKLNGINPLLHYILWGNDEGRLINFTDITYSTADFVEGKHVDSIINALKNKISIIIPIYNAFEDLKKCIESVFNNTFGDYELILINDNSTDRRIKPFLDSISESNDNVIVIHNDDNKGFVKNVNIGLNLSKSDVVLLNSDTIVSPNWLLKLVSLAYSKDNVGTVTPISNNAGAFSIYDDESENLPSTLSINDIANIIEKSSDKIFMNAPTGNGFCMFIKRDAIDIVGGFDEDTFGKGYGEENDFCMRLVGENWLNLIDDSTFIFHKKGASFSNQRAILIKKHLKILNDMYPNYDNLIKNFLNSKEIKSIKNNAQLGLQNYESEKFDKKRILYVMHEAIGGTPKTNRDLMGVIEDYYDCYLLTSNGNYIFLYHFIDNDTHIINKWALNSRWVAENFFIEEFRDIYFNILTKYSIDLVHVRHLINHTFDLPSVADTLNIPVVLSFHDFYFICLSYNLLDGNNVYCGGKCSENDNECILLNDITNIYDIKKFVPSWRKMILEMFDKIDCFITTSDIVKDIFAYCYPSMDLKNFHVIEHGRDFENFEDDLFDVPSLNKPIKILFIGNINVQKGSNIIKDLYEFDKNKMLEMHFLGNTIWELEKIGVHHGTYDRDNLLNEIKKIKPSFIGIFSIWSETYCHTLTESLAYGIPVLTTKIGVLEDRLISTGGGWFIDMDSVEKTYDLILSIAGDADEYLSKTNTIRNLTFKSILEMGNEYLNIYNSLI